MLGMLEIESISSILRAGSKHCPSNGVSFLKINRTVPFYFLHWLNMLKNDFSKQGARKGIADSTYKEWGSVYIKG
jgi:hypothetical protein